jgi:hypothetical protein
MRDDRYRGTSLPGPVRKLCQMAEREADRAHPDRLRQQAVAAFVSGAGKEISPEFRRRLREHDAVPSLFGANDLATTARTGLEAEIALNINARHGDSMDAVREALRRRGEGYAREQKCRLVADRHPNASIASESVKKAFDDCALVAATLILDGRPAPRISDRVLVSENLLVQPSGGAGL